LNCHHFSDPQNGAFVGWRALRSAQSASAPLSGVAAFQQLVVQEKFLAVLLTKENVGQVTVPFVGLGGGLRRSTWFNANSQVFSCGKNPCPSVFIRG
jgi:hypothetical protein